MLRFFVSSVSFGFIFFRLRRISLSFRIVFSWGSYIFFLFSDDPSLAEFILCVSGIIVSLCLLLRLDLLLTFLSVLMMFASYLTTAPNNIRMQPPFDVWWAMKSTVKTGPHLATNYVIMTRMREGRHCIFTACLPNFLTALQHYIHWRIRAMCQRRCFETVMSELNKIHMPSEKKSKFVWI